MAADDLDIQHRAAVVHKGPDLLFTSLDGQGVSSVERALRVSMADYRQAVDHHDGAVPAGRR
jgi:hypothetical protein